MSPQELHDLCERAWDAAGWAFMIGEGYMGETPDWEPFDEFEAWWKAHGASQVDATTTD